MSLPDHCIGLAVCGGASSRMGHDKSMIDYHGQVQRHHIADMLHVHCTRVFISLNEVQQHIPGKYPVMTDIPVCRHQGPASALLTAAAFFPGCSFLVMGCDYPLLTQAGLDLFVAHIADPQLPAAFYNEAADCYEPLLAYYTREAAALALAEHGRLSLQQLLRQTGAMPYVPADPGIARSIDDPAEAEVTRDYLKSFPAKTDI